MELPKLYRPVTAKFWGLRNGIGAGMGVIFDIDTLVERRIMRVLSRPGSGWKWQIVNASRDREWDYFIESDQECLDSPLDLSDSIESWK